MSRILLRLTESLSDQIGSQAMSVRIPVSIPNVLAESVQEDFVLIGKKLHRFSQVQKINLLALREIL